MLTPIPIAPDGDRLPMMTLIEAPTAPAGSGRPPRTGTRPTAPPPDPLDDFRALAAAETIEEARAIWSDRIGPGSVRLRRLAGRRNLAPELVDVARLIEESPRLAKKDAAGLRRVAVERLASLIVHTSEATPADKPTPARSKAKTARKKVGRPRKAKTA